MPDNSIFRGCIPAIMTPCSRDGIPNFDALVKTAQSLIADGMRAVVYCGSMGDWPLLSDEQRQEGVRRAMTRARGRMVARRLEDGRSRPVIGRER